jgi:hypothetical protein
MVEGPQCHLKAQAISAACTGRRVARAVCPGRGLSGAQLRQLRQRVLLRVDVVGKECFLVLDGDFVLRVHFGMSGGHRVRRTEASEAAGTPALAASAAAAAATAPPAAAAVGAKLPTLTLHFDGALELIIVDSTVGLREGGYLTERLGRASRDVVAPPGVFDRGLVRWCFPSCGK